MEIATGTKRAVIYLRVSTAEQAQKGAGNEGFSLPAQREACAKRSRALSATVVEEFVERGASGRTAQRPALQAMLARLQEEPVDYVIVHKLDRLARNRADDVAIVMAIRKSGAQVVSVSENVDETPSGLLLHGIMSSIAEFYSSNLGAEVRKGTTAKARQGGTPYRAPLGYLNRREDIDGREVRSVVVDPERGPRIAAAFDLYATGEYSLSDLAGILEANGLRNRPKVGKPSQPIGSNRLRSILRCPYYAGVVSYGGKEYAGTHQPLVDAETWERVQQLLDSRRTSGERSWRHHHYLRGSIYCAACGSRLIYTRANGNGGTYEYFVCSGRSRGICKQRHHRARAVEQAIERYYRTVALSFIGTAERVRQDVETYLAGLAEGNEAERERVTGALLKLEQQERKLLQAYYSDDVSQDLYREERTRIKEERQAADRLAAELENDHSQALDALDVALGLLDRVDEAYLRAPEEARRLLNQAIFARIEIWQEQVEAAELAEPFDTLNAGWGRDVVRPRTQTRTETDAQPGWTVRWGADFGQTADPGNAKTSRLLKKPGGSNVVSLIPPAGLEPATVRLKVCCSNQLSYRGSTSVPRWRAAGDCGVPAAWPRAVAGGWRRADAGSGRPNGAAPP